MLTCLRIRNFAIIDELEVELDSGLNVVTGETGAGKSILVAALELVLGGRASPDVVRTGATAAEIEALFEYSPDSAFAARLEAGGFPTAGELTIRRIIASNGRSRAYVNGRLTTAAELSELAAGLADISSQHEHHTLADPSSHLLYLDAFARLGPARAEAERAYEAVASARAQLLDLEAQAQRRGDREDYLRYQLREIEELGITPNEEPDLLAERERLRHAERLAQVASAAEDALYANDDAICSVLGKLAHDVREASRFDTRLTEFGNQLDAARTQLEETARDLGRYARGIALDPDRLTTLEERLDRIGRLKRKYGSVAGILEHFEHMKQELDGIEGYDERVAALRSEYESALATARTVVMRLRKERHRAAEKLSAAISEQLGSLGMGDARVLVEVAPLSPGTPALDIDGARLSPTGIDRAEFLIAPNRGEEARPLRRVASGGESSRAMLAIKRVLADLGPSGMYVFDEVDAGVGGAVAEVIGRKLKDVASHHQVLCITHLPQIAVFGDTHLQVEKRVLEGRTQSRIRRLRDDERLSEVARMLGGVKITERTRAAAAEMLAEAGKASPESNGKSRRRTKMASKGQAAE